MDLLERCYILTLFFLKLRQVSIKAMNASADTTNAGKKNKATYIKINQTISLLFWRTQKCKKLNPAIKNGKIASANASSAIRIFNKTKVTSRHKKTAAKLLIRIMTNSFAKVPGLTINDCQKRATKSSNNTLPKKKNKIIPDANGANRCANSAGFIAIFQCDAAVNC